MAMMFSVVSVTPSTFDEFVQLLPTLSLSVACGCGATAQRALASDSPKCFDDGNFGA